MTVRAHPGSRRMLVALALALVTTAAGCGGTSGKAAEPTSPTARPATHRTITVPPDPVPSGIHLSFLQQRLDEGGRVANIRVINGTHRLLHVRKVGLDWPGYPGRPQALDYEVPGQLTIDLKYLLPRAVCTASAGRARADAVVTTPRRTIRRPIDAESERFLTRIWRTTCNERRLRQAVSVGYGPSAGWTDEGTGLRAVLHARLLLTRRDRAVAVSVDQVQGSVLFELKTPGGRLLPPGDSAVSLPLDISPGRCDQHGRSQSQQTFIWRVWLKLANGEPIAEIVQPTSGQQARLLAFLDHACG